MSVSATLGTALGLVLVFALLALFCSGVTETIANLTQMRANYLLTGLRSMLDRPEAEPPPGMSNGQAKKELNRSTKIPDQTRAAAAAVRGELPEVAAATPAESGLTLALFDHPLVKAMQTRRTRWLRPGDGALRNPQYLSPEVFTRALIDTVLPAPSDPVGGTDTLARLDAALATGPVRDLPSARALRALIAQAEGNLRRFEEFVQHWYDEQMKRIAGWYKRWAKVILGMVGLVVAVVVNIDAIQLAHGLYVDEPVRQAVVATAESGTLCQNRDTAADRAACAKEQLTQLDAAQLPIGYPADCRFAQPAACWAWSPGAQRHWWNFPLKLLGWVITAFAVSFGAPFWFDALSRLGSLRTSGPRPAG